MSAERGFDRERVLASHFALLEGLATSISLPLDFSDPSPALFVLPPPWPLYPPAQRRVHLRLVPSPPDASFDSSKGPVHYCETCGRVDASDESGVFRTNAGEGFNPQDDE